jgi:Lrp/AsnC family transcriptional regulator, leucine-responsive regulatory protein
MSEVELDRLDRLILDALQKNNLASADRLSETIGLSPSAIQRRAKRLRKEKVIVGDVSVINPRMVGQKATFIVEVNLERENAEVVSTFKRRMLAAPEVQQCYFVTGDSDFILIVTARDIEEYDEIAQRLMFEGGCVRKYKTSVVLSRVKATLALPIEEPA